MDGPPQAACLWPPLSRNLRDSGEWHSPLLLRCACPSVKGGGFPEALCPHGPGCLSVSGDRLRLRRRGRVATVLSRTDDIGRGHHAGWRRAVQPPGMGSVSIWNPAGSVHLLSTRLCHSRSDSFAPRSGRSDKPSNSRFSVQIRPFWESVSGTGFEGMAPARASRPRTAAGFPAGPAQTRRPDRVNDPASEWRRSAVKRPVQQASQRPRRQGCGTAKMHRLRPAKPLPPHRPPW